MNIEEARTKLRECEYVIEDCLNAFMDETGLQITDIRFVATDVSAINSATFRIKAQIKVGVTL